MLGNLKGKVEENMGEDQFGFRKGKGRRGAIGCMRMLAEGVLEMETEIYIFALLTGRQHLTE